MWKYLIKALSRAIGFSKTESKGTLVLIFIIFIAFLGTQFRISYIKNQSTVAIDSSAHEWVKKVQASYEIKPEREEEYDKTVFLPIKKKERKKYTRSQPSEPVEVIPKKIIVADLNTATRDQLQTVRGIGPAFSERITKYRDLLGGFADTTQLKEVYGLQQETITELLKHFQVQSEVSSIPINADSIKVLAKHPYISYDLARIIINYRKLHGDIQSAEDLRKIKAIDERTFLRLKPYLKYGYAKNP